LQPQTRPQAELILADLDRKTHLLSGHHDYNHSAPEVDPQYDVLASCDAEAVEAVEAVEATAMNHNVPVVRGWTPARDPFARTPPSTPKGDIRRFCLSCGRWDRCAGRYLLYDFLAISRATEHSSVVSICVALHHGEHDFCWLLVGTVARRWHHRQLRRPDRVATNSTWPANALCYHLIL
jgi:hypothetical protein